MAVRGDQAGPFFKFQDNKPLTKASFTQDIRAALQVVGLPYENFAEHSFRIGAATAGIEYSTIRMMSCWNSSAFLIYIRTPPRPP